MLHFIQDSYAIDDLKDNAPASAVLKDTDADDEFFFTVPETFCQGIGYLLYCSALLMFTWMSVLCFDLMR